MKLSEKLQLNTNLSTGFMAPDIDNVGKMFDPSPGVVVVSNPDLEPEYTYNADIGLSKDFSGIVAPGRNFIISLRVII